MTYYVAYQLADGHTDALELQAADLAEAEFCAMSLLTRYFGDAWGIIGVRTRSGLILC